MWLKKLLGYREVDKGVPEVLVQWEGFGSKYNSWQPLLNLVTPNEVLMNYFEEKNIPLDLPLVWRLQNPQDIPL